MMVLSDRSDDYGTISQPHSTIKYIYDVRGESVFRETRGKFMRDSLIYTLVRVLQ